jgi:putative membrane protein
MGAFERGLLLVTAALSLSGLGFAQSDYSAEFHANGNGGVQTADREFMSKAAQEGMAKFQLAYAALQNAHSEEVKAFARQVLADYYKSQGALIDIANQQFIALPTEPDPKDKATLNSLLQLHGEAFDKAYMQTMLDGHRSDLAQFKQEAKSGNNQAVIDWANQNLPTLQSQYKEAEKVAPIVGVEITGSKGKTKSDTAAQPPH